MALLCVGCPGEAAPKARSVVLSCATDREVAQDLLDQFEKESGIKVEAKFDTEAAKATGLVQAIRAEKAQPRCDVLWGGGPFFGTILAEEGCLAALPASVLDAHGKAPRDPAGRWLGFGATYRVLLVNTAVLESSAWPHSIRDLADPRFKGHAGIANPLFGGSAAFVAALFAKLGESEGRRFLEGLKANDVAVCAGNADVKDRVASGELWFGVTVGDDAHAAISGGKPVAVVFPDQEPGGLGTLRSFGTVAVIAGAPHPEEALALVRFLASTRTERALSKGPQQSVGLLAGDEDVRPDWIPRDVKTMDVSWAAAAAAHPVARKAVEEILLGR
jgi:iron(III) transport system substrate-binding protein